MTTAPQVLIIADVVEIDLNVSVGYVSSGTVRIRKWNS
jgi:hypothetical protein